MAFYVTFYVKEKHFLCFKENCGKYTFNTHYLLIPASMTWKNAAQSAKINNILIAGSMLAANWAQIDSSNFFYQLTLAVLAC